VISTSATPLQQPSADSQSVRQRVEARYQEIEKRFAHCIEVGRVDVDPYLGQETDKPDSRKGLTLIARPNQHSILAIKQALETLAPALGAQYIQPASDMHSTVLSVIPCSTDYPVEDSKVREYIDAVNAAINSNSCSFLIEYQGVTASSDAVIVKGYPNGSALQHLRDALLQNLRDRNLETSFDRRYPIIAAHITVIRFVEQPKNLNALAQLLLELNDQQLGASTINQLELVENDWYMRASSVCRRGSYQLQPG